MFMSKQISCRTGGFCTSAAELQETGNVATRVTSLESWKYFGIILLPSWQTCLFWQGTSGNHQLCMLLQATVKLTTFTQHKRRATNQAISCESHLPLNSGGSYHYPKSSMLFLEEASSEQWLIQRCNRQLPL